MAMAWRQIITNTKGVVSIPSQQAISTPGFSRFFSKSSSRYIVKVGIPEFLNGIGKGVEAHVAKLESDIGDLHKLLVTRTLKLKKLGIPCQQFDNVLLGIPYGALTLAIVQFSVRIGKVNMRDRRKLILKYAHKYRLGLWRPRAEPVKAK